jgi:hypothetical protein
MGYTKYVKKIVCIGGNSVFAKKIEEFELDSLNSENFTYHLGHNFLEKKYKIGPDFSAEIEKIIKDKRLRRNAQLFSMYNYGKYFFESPYFRTRSNFLLFSKYRITDFNSLKLVLRHVSNSKMLFLLFSLGFLRVPTYIVKSLLSINVKVVNEFERILNIVEPQVVMLLDNGSSPIFFLMNIVNKGLNRKFILLIYSWDNPTTKLFVSNVFDFIGTWNQEQIQELETIYGYSPNKCKVIGSNVSDRAYSRNKNLTPLKVKTSKSTSTLMVLGMAANSDELLDVIGISKIISSGESIYTHIVYRPHPLCAYSQKMIIKFQKEISELHIQVDKEVDFSLEIYDAVICFPSTLLLDVIVSLKPAVFYTPRYPKWRSDPNIISRASYFNKLNSLNCISRVDSFTNLVSFIKVGLPNQQTLEMVDFETILPRLDMKYAERVNEFIRSID